MRAVSSGVTPCGEASSRRLPGSMPAGYVSHTGYQYDSISLVAGQRELAPPSKFLKLGGFNRSVFITEVNGTSPFWPTTKPDVGAGFSRRARTLVRLS